MTITITDAESLRLLAPGAKISAKNPFAIPCTHQAVKSNSPASGRPWLLHGERFTSHEVLDRFGGAVELHDTHTTPAESLPTVTALRDKLATAETLMANYKASRDRLLTVTAELRDHARKASAEARKEADANTRLQARVKHLREVIKSERARVDVARTTAAALRASVDGMRRERDAAVEELAKVNSDATIMARNLEAAHGRVDTLTKQARSSEIYGGIHPSWTAYEALVEQRDDARKRADRAEKIRADAVRALNAALSGVDNA